MEDMFEKMIVLTIIYGGIILIANKGAAGDLVKFSCAVGMLVFIVGGYKNMEDIGNVILSDIDTVKESAYKGEKMLNADFNSEIKDYIEKDIQAICSKYGARGDVEIKLTIEGEKAEIEWIELTGSFGSEQGMGFIKNEIIDKYQVDEVKIFEK